MTLTNIASPLQAAREEKQIFLHKFSPTLPRFGEVFRVEQNTVAGKHQTQTAYRLNSKKGHRKRATGHRICFAYSVSWRSIVRQVHKYTSFILAWGGDNLF